MSHPAPAPPAPPAPPSPPASTPPAPQRPPQQPLRAAPREPMDWPQATALWLGDIASALVAHLPEGRLRRFLLGPRVASSPPQRGAPDRGDHAESRPLPSAAGGRTHVPGVQPPTASGDRTVGGELQGRRRHSARARGAPRRRVLPDRRRQREGDEGWEEDRRAGPG